jgi:hypothetical protein
MGFKPGASGNPAGRPRGSGLGIRELAQTYGPEMLTLLVQKARKGSLAAIVHVLDRAYGKPEICVDFKVLFEKKLSELTEDELLALRERMTALTAIPAPVLEHHETDGEE